MKPSITLKLYNSEDRIAKLETNKVKDIWQALREIEFTYGTLRVDYDDGMYNEASFSNDREAKLLLSVFREKSLLDYLYSGGV